MTRIGPISDDVVRDLLAELEQAEQAADRPRSDVVLGTLFREYLGPRLQNARVALTGLDLDILDRMAVRSFRAGRHDDAINPYHVAIDTAIQLADTPRLVRAHLGAANVQLARLDFAATAEHIAAVAAIPASPQDVVVLRARLTAAQGQLARADELLAGALARVDGQPEETREWAIRLAEIRIDRGDFAGFEQLRSTHATGDITDERWSMLLGTVQSAQGRLTTALESFRRVLVRVDPDADPDLVYAARWHAIQALVVLNRLDEAEDERLLLDPAGRGRDDHRAEHLLAAWIAARRGVAGGERAVPVTSPLDELACCLPGGAIVGRRQLRTRWRERIAEECAYLTTCALLQLRAGDLDAATRTLEWLDRRMHGLESPLLQARRAFVAALLAHGGERWDEAVHSAAIAATAYRALGMPIQEWGALRVLTWSAARGSASTADELTALQTRGADILARIVDGLDARDGLYFQLSKWSTGDEQRARACRACARGDLDAVAALQQIVDLRLWHALSDGSAPAAPASEPAVQDVYTLARSQSALWSDTPELPCRMTRVRPAWLPRDTAVAHYVVLPDRVELFLVTRAGARRVALPPLPKAELMALLRSAVRFLRNQRWHAHAEALVSLSERLGADHLHALPAAIRRLFVIPDGALAGAPFGALVVGDKPLLERFVLTSVPRWTWTTRRRRPCEIRQECCVAVETSSAAPADLFPPLPEVAAALASLAPSNGQRTTLTGPAACTPAVLAALSAAESALFMCHGRFDPHQPGSSGLLLADAWLTLEHLVPLRLERLQLAVLAACEVGDAVPLPGAEALGFPDALLLRGTTFVVTPQWRVPPQQTVEFVSQLFEALADHDPAEALAHTRRAWFQEGKDSRVWAAFELHASGIDANWLARLRLRLPW